MSSDYKVAGHGCVVAKLMAAEDGKTLLAAVGNQPYKRIEPPARIASFCAAKNAPIFYGATTCGMLMAIMCDVATGEITVLVRPVPSVCVQDTALPASS